MTADPGDQLGLFGADTSDRAEPVPARPALPSTRLSPGGSPKRVVRVLQDIRDGRLAVLDVSGQIMERYGDDRVRLAPDDDVAAALMAQGYAAEQGDRHRITCKHGAISRPVTPLRLTPDGKRLLLRWSSLAHFNH